MQPIWDVALHRSLRQGTSRFELDVRFRTASSRVVLFGPSGSGKTQTLRIISGTAQPDHGRIAVAGRVLLDSDVGVRLTPQQRALGYVYQDYALFPHLTVLQNVAFARRPGWRNPARNGVITRSYNQPKLRYNRQPNLREQPTRRAGKPSSWGESGGNPPVAQLREPDS